MFWSLIHFIWRVEKLSPKFYRILLVLQHEGKKISLKDSEFRQLIKLIIRSCVCAKSLQSCLTLCNPMDCSLPGSSVHWSLQSRILEWVAISPCRGSYWLRDRTCFSYISWIGRWFSTTSITSKSVVLKFQVYQNFLESLLKHKLLGPTSRIFDAVNSCGVWEFASLTNCQGIVMLVKWKSLICVQLFGTPWTIQSMGFSSPEYWSGWPFPSPGDLPNPGTSHCRSLHCRDHRTQVSRTTVRFFTSWASGEAQ